jgi:hypothetical protein
MRKGDRPVSENPTLTGAGLPTGDGRSQGGSRERPPILSGLLEEG